MDRTYTGLQTLGAETVSHWVVDGCCTLIALRMFKKKKIYGTKHRVRPIWFHNFWNVPFVLLLKEIIMTPCHYSRQQSFFLLSSSEETVSSSSFINNLACTTVLIFISLWSFWYQMSWFAFWCAADLMHKEFKLKGSLNYPAEILQYIKYF